MSPGPVGAQEAEDMLTHEFLCSIKLLQSTTWKASPIIRYTMYIYIYVCVCENVSGGREKYFRLVLIGFQRFGMQAISYFQSRKGIGIGLAPIGFARF